MERQIIERTGVGNDNHANVAEPLLSLAQACEILLKTFTRIPLNPMLFQKSIELVAGRDTRAELITTEAALTVGLKSDRLKRHARAGLRPAGSKTAPDRPGFRV